MQRARALKMPADCTIDMLTVASRLRTQVVPVPDAVVLTDDRAPVNYLRSQKPEDAAGAVDTLELLDGQTYKGKLVDRGDEQVSFRVAGEGGTSALMVWPTRSVEAVTVDGVRHVINAPPAGGAGAVEGSGAAVLGRSGGPSSARLPCEAVTVPGRRPRQPGRDAPARRARRPAPHPRFTPSPAVPRRNAR